MTTVFPNTATLSSYMAQKIADGSAKTVTRDELTAQGFIADPKEEWLNSEQAAARGEAEAAAAARMKSDDAPENVWGQIIVGGNVVAEIYKNGSMAYSGNAKLDIDTSKPLKEIARDIMNQIGGYLQPGVAFTSQENHAAAFSDAKRQLQARLSEYLQSDTIQRRLSSLP